MEILSRFRDDSNPIRSQNALKNAKTDYSFLEILNEQNVK